MPTKTPSKNVPANSSRSNSAPDAIELLESDHREVEALFEKFESARNDATKRKIAEDVCNALAVHAQVEEEIFYPACREAGVDSDLMNEAAVEHASAKELIAQILGGSGDEMWEAKVIVLSEQIEHHVEEEEGEMFVKARKAGLDSAKLGQRMAARKAELQASVATSPSKPAASPRATKAK
ncbi:MAG: hemerythrin domain-containing protein [Deltaproteobacteria bacterium]|nr:hemerythrin domain-containing protein [Deltaproteobacteria bacterium]